MLKILHVIPTLAARYGGPAAALPPMAAALAERGHQVDVFSTNADGIDGRLRLDVPTGKPMRVQGVTYTYFSVHIPKYYLASIGLARALGHQLKQTDIVHVHSLYRFHTQAACGWARRRGVPYVIRPHGTLDAYHRGQKVGRKRLYEFVLERRNLAHAAAMHYTSDQERRSTEGFGLLAPGVVVPLGIDVAGINRPTDGLQLLGDRPECADAEIVLFLGRITEKKRVEVLLRAFQIVATTRPRALLVIAGPDDEGIGTRIRRESREMGIGDRVVLTGTVEGDIKRGLLQRATVFALPSKNENFGVAVVEAMAAMLPVVVTEGVALHQDVVRASAGLVAPGTPQAFGEAILRLLENPGLARRSGLNGRALVESQYTWAQVAARLEDVYHSLIGRTS